jgi:hypothetical protein
MNKTNKDRRQMLAVVWTEQSHNDSKYFSKSIPDACVQGRVQLYRAEVIAP